MWARSPPRPFGDAVTHAAEPRLRVAITRSSPVTFLRQPETYTLRTGPSDFSREPIVPGWI